MKVETLVEILILAKKNMYINRSLIFSNVEHFPQKPPKVINIFIDNQKKIAGSSMFISF